MKPSFTISIAPMMDVSDRHFRFFLRQITKRALLYTPMITAQAIARGDRHDLLDFSPEEQPVALQLGGDDPKLLAEAARVAEEWGYSEVNLNVGCPSDRVQNGNFGACLMATPERVANIVATMKAAVNIPVTVKHRIGIDDLDSYAHLTHFVKTIAATGCDRFIVHARKAWLKGLSPKENRTVPPLRYDEVYQLKRDFPNLPIVINGGIRTLEQARWHLEHVDGVMIGRAAQEDPYCLANVDVEIFGDETSPPTREEIVKTMTAYIAKWSQRGISSRSITRHLMGLYSGIPGSRAWRRQLTSSQIL